jgi:hypothetical protein
MQGNGICGAVKQHTFRIQEITVEIQRGLRYSVSSKKRAIKPEGNQITKAVIPLFSLFFLRHTDNTVNVELTKEKSNHF